MRGLDRSAAGELRLSVTLDSLSSRPRDPQHPCLNAAVEARLSDLR